MAEERGLINELGDWTLAGRARHSLLAGSGRGGGARVAVNVSAAQMMDEGFAERALHLVRAQGWSPA